MNKKTLIAPALIVLAFLAGKYLFPNTKVEVKTVVKTVEVEKKQERKNKTVVSTKVKKKDGTVVTETKVVENSDTVTDKASKSVVTVAEKRGSGLTLGVLAIKNASNFRETDFGATLTLPIMGKLKLQALGTTKKEVGLGVAIEF